jgi:hypothetical protein
MSPVAQPMQTQPWLANWGVKAPSDPRPDRGAP